jgi:outer membrane protein TolC
LRADTARAVAAKADYRQVRERVTLAVANLYLQALADRARVASAESQVQTAETLVQLATDQKTSGLVAQIDVLRQQVELESARAQLIDARNDLEKRKLALGRAIGLPATQAIELTTSSEYHAMPAMTLDAALAQAAGHRSDLDAAVARADAARLDTRAASAARLPSLRVHADVGALGADAGSALKTYSLAASVHIPVFAGGQAAAHTQEQAAIAQEREAEAADLREGVSYDVRSALLDLDAATASVTVAQSRARLAREELTQAQDRFRAGVASSIELVQAQEAVAHASEQEIATVLAHNIAKAGLALALGGVEDRFVAWIGGQQ